MFITRQTTSEQALFLVRSKLQFETIFKNRNLGVVDDTEDDTIFNMLNYLNYRDNYLLNKNKNEIINKTPTSATILAVNGKFRGSFNITYSVKNESAAGNFNLAELLEKAIFFDHGDKHRYNFQNPKDILNISISTENLRFFSVEVSQDSVPLSSIELQNII